MPNVLAKIAESTRLRVAAFKTELPLEKLRQFPLYKREPQDFRKAFLDSGANIIAEIKFASPSEGALRAASAQEAVQVAGSYLSAGAQALSVLAEPEFFSGSPEYLSAVRGKHPKAFVLMKDFFMDPYQFELARAHGADAVLLMVSLLGEGLGAMLKASQGLGLSALVEVHTEAELALAREVGAKIIGVNSRNLKTLKTDLEIARRLALSVDPAKTLLVAESGIKTRQDIEDLSRRGYRGFLVGTHLMRRPDPGAALKELLP